jgi:hypothetical protein
MKQSKEQLLLEPLSRRIRVRRYCARSRPLHSEYANFQKLRYWKLVAKLNGKRGHWLITRWGVDSSFAAKSTCPSWSQPRTITASESQSSVSTSESCVGRYRSFKANGLTSGQESNRISQRYCEPSLFCNLISMLAIPPSSALR